MGARASRTWSWAASPSALCAAHRAPSSRWDSGRTARNGTSAGNRRLDRQMKNFEVARLFDLMADVLELRGENPFRIRAYRRAAQNVESLTEDVEVVAREERLADVPGIGKDLAGKIVEYLDTGKGQEIEAAQGG